MASTLRASLESIKPYADRILIVEGRFKPEDTRPNPKYREYLTPHSVDETIEIASEFTDEIILFEDLPQHKARDKYLLGKNGDYYFILDADWILKGKLDKEMILEGKYSVYGVNRYCRDGSFEQYALLIFKHQDGIKHSIGQLPLIDSEGNLMDSTNYEVKPISQFWITHQNCLKYRKKKEGL